jgi:hypothetical protein
MDQNAIEEALTNYTEDDLGIDLSGKEVDIKLIAGRGGNGLRAEVEIVPLDAVELDEEAENDVEILDATAAEPDVEEPAIGPFD